MKSLTCFSLLILTAISFISCSKSDGTSAAIGSTTTPDSVTTFLTTGTWIIGSISEQKEDNTASFAGYSFTFSTDGKLTATKNGAQVTGDWHYSPAVTYYGSSSKNAVTISMGTNNPFRRLTKTWNLVSASATSIQLQNPELAEDEQVKFQK